MIGFKGIRNLGNHNHILEGNHGFSMEVKETEKPINHAHDRTHIA